MTEERQVVRLGRREGVAGESPVWELRFRGRVERTDRDGLRRGLARGRLSGIEDVRRTDGDWGPLFGRPIWREVFGSEVEPRDHAKAREAARVTRLQRTSLALGALALAALLAGWPGIGPVTSGLSLLLAAILAVGAGWTRLLAAVHRRALVGLGDRLVPPVLPPPPPPEDWQQLAADDEVAAYLRAGTAGGAGAVKES